MWKRWLGSVLMVAATAGLVVAQETSKGDVTVTVSYTGKAPVDEKHQLWVFLFNTPTVDATSRPLDSRAVTKNGASVKFEGLSASSGPLYVLALYDQQGGYDGRTGPPPAGTPIGMYSADRKAPTPLKIAPGAKVTVSFDNTMLFKP